MKREIRNIPGALDGSWCCPGHDEWPSDTYGSNRSKRARSRDKKKEHRHARRILNKITETT